MNKVTIFIMLLAVLCLAGCGNVYLRGEALTAAENSVMDAYQAVQRVGSAGVPPAGDTGETPVPTWLKAYLAENFKQWRFFVRSARKDETWGPKLEAERAAGSE